MVIFAKWFHPRKAQATGKRNCLHLSNEKLPTLASFANMASFLHATLVHLKLAARCVVLVVLQTNAPPSLASPLSRRAHGESAFGGMWAILHHPHKWVENWAKCKKKATAKRAPKGRSEKEIINRTTPKEGKCAHAPRSCRKSSKINRMASARLYPAPRRAFRSCTVDYV